MYASPELRYPGSLDKRKKMQVFFLPCNRRVTVKAIPFFALPQLTLQPLPTGGCNRLKEEKATIKCPFSHQQPYFLRHSSDKRACVSSSTMIPM